MRKILVALLLLTPLFLKAEPRREEYNIVVHVVGSRLLTACIPNGAGNFCNHMQSLTAVIDGKKVTLESNEKSDALLKTGDYNAKFVQEKPTPDYEQRIEYELLFHDGKTHKYIVVEILHE
jgi:hypothetical protein